jgi:hypothetical protein
MAEIKPEGRKFYGTVLRLWFFLIFSMLIMIIMFPIRLPLCGSGGNVEGYGLRLRDFVALLVTNVAAAAAIVRVRSRLLFLMVSIVALIAIDWLVARIFSIKLQLDPLLLLTGH